MAVHTLVIACGNPLRGDDGLGPAIAECVNLWHVPGVKVIVVHQLVPELIEELTCVERVLFIDAGVRAECSPFETREIEPRSSRVSLGHHQAPENLLALLLELEGRVPRAWLLSIAAESFDHGAELSPQARRHMQAALSWVREFLSEPSCTKSA